MFIAFLVFVGVATTAPIIAAVVVSAGSTREESGWTLGGPPPGQVHELARWIVGFHSEATELPQPKGRSLARSGMRAPGPEEVVRPSPAQPQEPAPAWQPRSAARSLTLSE